MSEEGAILLNESASVSILESVYSSLSPQRRRIQQKGDGQQTREEIIGKARPLRVWKGWN
jgi:hypothetical protein